MQKLIKPLSAYRDKFFNEIEKQKKGKVTVFYCGNPEMGRTLQQFANKYEFGFKKENF